MILHDFDKEKYMNWSKEDEDAVDAVMVLGNKLGGGEKEGAGDIEGENDEVDPNLP